MWLLVEEVYRELGGSFLAFGDFNDTVQESEKGGGGEFVDPYFNWLGEGKYLIIAG